MVFWRERGLVLDLQFAERSGTTVYDLSGNNNHGTIYGASWRGGPLLGALYFDGVDDWVNIPHSPTLCGWDETTQLVIFKTASDGPVLVKSWSSEYSHEIIGGKVKSRFIDANGTASEMYSNELVNDNKWHIVHRIWRTVQGGKRHEIWIDGVLDKSAVCDGCVNIGCTTQSLMIAHMEEWGGPYINAVIALVRIYNRALSESEIKAHYRYLMGRVQRIRRRLAAGVV